MAVVFDIFNMQFTVQIMRMEHGIVFAIELHRDNSVLLAHFHVEGGSCFDPFPFDMELSVTVGGENVCSHQLSQLIRDKMVPNGDDV